MKKNRSNKKKDVGNPYIEGVLFVNRKGVGFVSHDSLTEDVEIPSHKLDSAFHGDTVKVLLYPKSDRRRQGEVTEVLERAQTHFVGTLEEKEGKMFLKPDNARIHRVFSVEQKENLKPKYKAYGEVTSWGDDKNAPTINITEVLGEKGDHEAEMRSIVLAHDIDTSFPNVVEKEAEALKKEHKISTEGRLDLRDRKTCTIDPHNAKDFDDALSVKNLGNGKYEIGIHIADVSHFVRLGTELDLEARERAFSVYLVDRTIPMLPEILSNDLCSLNPNEEKYAFSALFEMDMEGNIHSEKFSKSVIESDKRFTYQEAQQVLDGKLQSPLYEELKILETISHAMRKDRARQGAIDFDTEEVEIELDEAKRPIKITKKERLETMRIVEDFMLLANKQVAKFLAHNTDVKTSVYRVHDKPNPEKLESLSILLKALGFKTLKDLVNISPKDIQKLIRMVEDKPGEQTVKTAILRSMAKATYTTTNIGHFGLAFEYYTHFTSPIRRYPDLMIHRILQGALEHNKQKDDLYTRYENILRKATEKEIAAMEAERDSIRMKQVEYMKEKVGEIFTGKISGMTEWGVYIEEVNTKIEGMVRIKDLGDDYFMFDEKTYSITGSHTKKKFALGDEVKVRLVGVNVDDRTIDWTLV